MTSKGILVECVEDMEIVNLDINFYKDVYYTALIENKIFIIDRQHKNIEITKKLFKKHFYIIK